MNKLFNCLLVVATITIMSFCIRLVQSQDNGYDYVPPEQQGVILIAPEPPPVILNGDVNADGMWCMDDPIQIIYHLYRDGRDLPCRNAADVDGNGSIDVNDVVLSLRFLFFGDEINQCPVSCLNTEDLYKFD